MLARMILPIIIMSGLLLASCGGPEIAAGQLYETNCVPCHGANREGVSGLGPTLIPQSLAALSDTEIRDAISNGRPGTPMIGWKGILSPEEIDALVQLVKHTSL